MEAGQEGPAAQPSLVSSDFAAHHPSEGGFLPTICLALGNWRCSAWCEGKPVHERGTRPAGVCVSVHSSLEKSWPDCSLGRLTPKVCVLRSLPESAVWSQSRCLQPPSYTPAYQEKRGCEPEPFNTPTWLRGCLGGWRHSSTLELALWNSDDSRTLEELGSR